MPPIKNPAHMLAFFALVKWSCLITGMGETKMAKSVKIHGSRATRFPSSGFPHVSWVVGSEIRAVGWQSKIPSKKQAAHQDTTTPANKRITMRKRRTMKTRWRRLQTESLASASVVAWMKMLA